MAERLLIIAQPKDWKNDLPGASVITPRDYLSGACLPAGRRTRVLNLCRSYRYLSEGYYCSLLAEARGHRVIPSVRTTQDLSRKSIYLLGLEDIDLRKALTGVEGEQYTLDICFGHCAAQGFREIARQVFAALPAPLLRVSFRRQGHWRIEGVSAPAIQTLDEAGRHLLHEGLARYLARPPRAPRARSARYDLAILHNPDESMPPSDRRALRAFERAGQAAGLNVDLIGPKDYGRLAEYDALFIRETTRIVHHTYRFARKALAEGMVVIDHPDDILRCANKVYLAELMRAHSVPTPRTLILSRGDLARIETEIGYPVVLKVPEGSFSSGVFRADDRAQMEDRARTLLRESDLILAQEYLYTPFDWRIGILNRQPLYACKYLMSKHHWQIVDYTNGKAREGGSFCVPLQDVPHEVIHTALRAANLIGDGLYGVDLKQVDGRVVVIEVNDNPSIESGVEDAVLGEKLYEAIAQDFRRRLDALRGR
ncbi:MAG: RimK family protein [Pseudomonadota bacterium]